MTSKDPLRVSLLGDFNLLYQGTPVAGLQGDRLQSLLAYLLLHRQEPQPRQAVSRALWPHSTESQARANLRNLLHSLRQTLPEAEHYLMGERNTLQWNPDTPVQLDVADFEAAFRMAQEANSPLEAKASLEQAINLYKGDLLPGCYDDWIDPLRETLYQQFLAALERLISLLEEAAEFHGAIRYSQRLIQQDPLSEEAHIVLMRLYAVSGDRAGVHRAYQACATLLLEEMGIEPSKATRTAYQELLGLQVEAPLPSTPGGQNQEPAPLPLVSQPVRPRPLPPPATPFIGRETELAIIASRLAEPSCRLLTLIGPGGIGKTRLALQAARGHLSLFADGVAYASLTSVDSPGRLLPALAEALGLVFSGPAPQLEQLLTFLADREMLLVLDNFEHLIEEGAALLGKILFAAPAVQLLVTSRERLHLSGEWTIEVEGLSKSNSTILGENSALTLFVQSARRTDSHFTLTDDMVIPAERICHLVGGIPLALELAASWVRLLSLPEIVQEIENNRDFLGGAARYLPERHRSLRAVFDYSWHLLSPAEQEALRQLSVFQGGFRREAARIVAAAGLPLLSALVDKSFLRWDAGTGRYSQHELLRQFALAHLQTELPTWITARRRHSTYYLTHLEKQTEALLSGAQQTAKASLTEDVDNLRAAWEWSVEQRELPLLSSALHALALFYELHSWLNEGLATFEKLLAIVRQPELAPSPLTRALESRALSWTGWFHFRQGWLEQARCRLEESITLARRLENQIPLAEALQMLGMVCHVGRDYEAAHIYLDEAIQLSLTLDDHWGQMFSLAVRGMVALGQGEYEQAYRLLPESLELWRAIGDLRIGAYCLVSWGTVAQHREDYDEAAKAFRHCLELGQLLHDRFSIANGLKHLAQLAALQGRLEEAQSYAQDSLALFQEIGDTWNSAQITGLLDEISQSQDNSSEIDRR